jgi:transcription antitermination factor NusG
MTFAIPHPIAPGTTRRGYQSEAGDRAWYPLKVRGGREAASKAKLVRAGIEAMYPISTRSRISFGKRIVWEVATVPGLIYARFDARPNWDVLLAERVIVGVYTHGGVPVSLSANVIAAIRGLPMNAERLEKAREEARRIRVGDMVRLDGGPFEGMLVEVTQIRDSRVWWTALWGKGETDSLRVARTTEG